MKATHLVAVLLVPGLGFAAGSAAVSVPFHLTPRGAVIVPVMVNGSTAASFLLDTGSNMSVIEEDLASALRATPVAKTTMLSASGQRDTLMTRIGQLSFGDERVRDVLASIAPAAALNPPDVAASGLTAQGILGQDVLAPLRYTIDYGRGTITWHREAGEPGRDARRFALERIDDRFAVVLPQGAAVLRLVPDTGSEALVLFTRGGRVPVPCVAATHANVALSGLAGTRPGRMSVVPILRIGTLTLTNVPAMVVSRDYGSRLVDGLLPLHLFERVTFNGPEQQLVIEGVRHPKAAR